MSVITATDPTGINDIKMRLAPAFDHEWSGCYLGELDEYAHEIQGYLLSGYSWQEALDEVNYSFIDKLRARPYFDW